MSEFIGDLHNTSNQLVLAAMVAVCMMYFVVNFLRSTASRLINEVRTKSAIIEAQYLYRAVWTIVHLSMCLCLGAVTLQQARLQLVKHLAIQNGVVNAMTISHQGISGEAYERLGGLVAVEDSEGLAYQDEPSEIEVTTPNGTIVSFRRSKTEGSDSSGSRPGGPMRGQTEARSGFDIGTGAPPWGIGTSGARFGRLPSESQRNRF